MNRVRVERCATYDLQQLRTTVASFDNLFSENIRPGDTVALKPNWIASHHKHNQEEWQAVITNPNVITAVLQCVVRELKGDGRILIADGPQTDQSFTKIMDRMEVQQWHDICNSAGIPLEIIDLRDHEWRVEQDVLRERKELPGDPRGSVEFDLGFASEFACHKPSKRGYYGADYDIDETTQAHSNGHHKYRISRSMVAADVFINLPKLKTHKKAGITCSLKNLVGVNTYKNFLPHHTEGTPRMGGDQFPESGVSSSLEVRMLSAFKMALLKLPLLSRFAMPVKQVGKLIFGETTETVRNGAWHGNDTLWRTILDLNKALLYGNQDSTFREDNPAFRKRYLTFVDAIIAGEGNGPECPDPIDAGLIFGGDNPVAVDCTCAAFMGFDYQRIPALARAFDIEYYSLMEGGYESIELQSNTILNLPRRLDDITPEHRLRFRPHFGWVGAIEHSTCRQENH